MVPSSLQVRRISRFQLARPAVELSFLLQTIRTPPVDAARVESPPFVTILSSSSRKAVARVCFLESNNFFSSIAFLSLFAGLLMRPFFTCSDGERPSSSLKEGTKGFRLTVFCGEY